MYISGSINLELTQNYDLLFVRFGKWIRNAALGQNDNGAIHGGPEPGDMCMPKKCASLPCDGEVVDVTLPWLYGALRDICWAISPTSSKLFDSVPDINPNDI